MDTANAYRLYDLLDSPFCVKVRVCLGLKSVPYERVPLTLARLPELRRLNPLGKVPVLVADGEAVADSSHIARLLDERFPRPALLPKDPAARAYGYVIEEWADESLSFIVGGFKFLNPQNRDRLRENTAEMASGLMPVGLAAYLVRRRVARRYRLSGFDEQSLAHLEERMRENLRHLQDLLGDNPFLLGKYATLADISVFAQLHWLAGYEERRLLDAVPTVRKWMAQFEDLEPVQQALRGEPPAVAIEELVDEVDSATA